MKNALHKAFAEVNSMKKVGQNKNQARIKKCGYS